jgi:hypothetical protein
MDDFVTRYVEMWNEPDPARRRATVEALWHPDAGNYTDRITAEGHDAIEKRVAASYEEFIGAGYRFEQFGDAEAHHDVVRVRWVMVPAAGGPPEAAGSEILVLADDGRIRTDHQFIDPVPVTS